jgi:uncharacterized membrane protein YcfT
MYLDQIMTDKDNLSNEVTILERKLAYKYFAVTSKGTVATLVQESAKKQICRSCHQNAQTRLYPAAN